jgi:hypothetical protein
MLNNWSNEWEEWDEMEDGKGFFAAFGIVAILMLTLNVAFWGGLIYFAFWCAQHFGVI